MPNGRVHNFATVSLSLMGGCSLYASGAVRPSQALAFSTGCLLGLLLSPDLDLKSGNVSRANARHLLGMAGWLWGALWWPYAWFIPHHRSWLSHAPIIGTLGRLLYLAVLLLPVLLFVGLRLTISDYQLRLLLLALGGLVVSDTAHALMDKVF